LVFQKKEKFISERIVIIHMAQSTGEEISVSILTLEKFKKTIQDYADTIILIEDGEND